MNHQRFSKAKWYIDLCNRFEALMHNLGIPPEAGEQIKDLCVQVALEQYKVGNKCGIRWAYEQQEARVSA